MPQIGARCVVDHQIAAGHHESTPRIQARLPLQHLQDELFPLDEEYDLIVVFYCLFLILIFFFAGLYKKKSNQQKTTLQA
jgi:hypothetical protein